jgi:hypothetical protein
MPKHAARPVRKPKVGGVKKNPITRRTPQFAAKMKKMAR